MVHWRIVRYGFRRCLHFAYFSDCYSMRAYRIALILLLVWATSLCAEADQKRSRVEVVKFKLTNTCPSTGLKRKGPCPGHEVDHIIPLCAGGADKVANMQWLRVETHKVKTKKDVKHCAILRKKRKGV